MGAGIIVCGLNGSGKSTLGKILADSLGFHFIDVEDLYFTKTDPSHMYASQRTQEEVKRLFAEEVKKHPDFVFASVTGKYCDDASELFKCAILIDVPKDVRMKRVKERSFRKFGGRMLEGGDLYEREEAFFEFVSSRSERYAEDWAGTLSCPVIRVDGTKPIEENAALILEQIKKPEN